MKLILRVLVFAAAIYTAYALCNTCSALTGLACVANDQFKFCTNGLPVSPAIQCPSGTVCSATAEICSPVGSVPPSCARCGTCSDTKLFACITYNTFAMCYGTDVPDTVIITCPGTTVCNVDSPSICVDPATTGIGGTCPSVTTTSSSTSTSSTSTSTTTAPSSTTPNPATDPQAYCKNLASRGRYEIMSDPNCQSYVYCTVVNSTWIGNVYECPGTTRFNATSQLCGIEIPTRCDP